MVITKTDYGVKYRKKPGTLVMYSAVDTEIPSELADLVEGNTFPLRWFVNSLNSNSGGQIIELILQPTAEDITTLEKKIGMLYPEGNIIREAFWLHQEPYPAGYNRINFTKNKMIDLDELLELKEEKPRKDVVIEDIKTQDISSKYPRLTKFTTPSDLFPEKSRLFTGLYINLDFRQDEDNRRPVDETVYWISLLKHRFSEYFSLSNVEEDELKRALVKLNQGPGLRVLNFLD